MSILIFVIVLAVLIFVHELGHFIAAKKSGIKVEEFGIGFPPKIWSRRKGETLYSINAIPFGGFVKIFGENPEPEPEARYGAGPSEDFSSALFNKPRLIQAAVLAAGVIFNVLFAWLLVSTGFLIGLPTSTSYSGTGEVQNPRSIVTYVAKGSPAEKASLKIGDAIVGASSEGSVLKEVTPRLISNFIEAHGKEGLTLTLSRGKKLYSANLVADEASVAGRSTVGIGIDEVGTLKLPVHRALWEGGKTVVNLTLVTAKGIIQFIGSAFVGKADLSQVTGPVGIVGLVGDVTNLGFVYLLSFTAIISINLAIINLLPFPALDGGRLLFLGIEAIRRKPISPKVANKLNQIGFALLILLMVVVTFHDIVKLF